MSEIKRLMPFTYFKREEFGNFPLIDFTPTDNGNYVLYSDHLAAVSALEAEVERLKQEAQIHAQEARTQKATVHEIYQIVTEGKGEPGDWNGAEPVRKAFNSLRAALAATQWISVSERLPEGGQSVLVVRPRFRGGQDVCLEFYDDSGDQYTRGFYLEGEMDTNLTHWMQLPTPPKEAA